MKVFMIAGEPSGDVLGGGLMQSLRTHIAAFDQDVEFHGVGGDTMIQQGLDSLLPMDEICVMGIWEVLFQLPRLIKIINGLVEEIEAYNPDVLITVDLPDFNFEVAKRLKKRGVFKGKIIHYVAPTVWAWRPGRAKKISAFLDGLMCLFPFEPDYFTKHGLETKYVGHPLIRKTREQDDVDFRERYDLGADDLVLSVYLGSRMSEIKKHQDTFKEVINFMLEAYPDIQVFFPTLPQNEYDVHALVADIKAATFVVSDPDKKWDIMRISDLAMAVSGTVGLELAVMGTPHVIAYKAHPITWLIARLLVKVKFAHLANILLNREAVPEFLQHKCKAIAIAPTLLRLQKNDDLRQKQADDFAEVRELLKKDVDANPSETAAKFILSQV